MRKKIGLLGNMNNNFNTLTKYLRDRGLDADLLLYEHEQSNFLPKDDEFGDRYKNYTKQLEWGTYSNLYLKDQNLIRKDLEPYDILIGSRLAPAYVQKIGRKLDLFIPSGGDIWTVPFFSGLQAKNIIKYLFYSRIQRKGIINSKSILFDTTNKIIEDRIKPIVREDKRIRMGIPMLYTPEYNPIQIKDSYNKATLYPRFKAIREAYDIVIFHHTKHLWTKKNVRSMDQYQDKANDRLFKGFKKFKEEYPESKACIITINFGWDADNSKKLCSELGIEKDVHWFELTSRKEIMVGISLADMVVGELKNSWFSYGVVYEALAMGKPIIHNRKDELYSDKESMYPMIFAEKSTDITKALVNYVKDKEKYKTIGKEGMKWFQEHAIKKPMDAVVNVIESITLSDN